MNRLHSAQVPSMSTSVPPPGGALSNLDIGVGIPNNITAS